MKYQNVIHPEQEYKAFGQALIRADPRMDDILEDQDVINIYNEIKDKDPSITLDQIIPLLPQIVPQIVEKASPGEVDQNKLNALESIPMGE